MTAYDPAAPAKIAPALHDGYLATKKLIADVNSSSLSEDDKANVDWELERKLDQFNSALAEALGLQIDALTTPGKSVTQASIFSPGVEDTRAAATPGSDVYVRLRLLNASALQKSAPKLVKTWVTSPVDAASSVEQLAVPKPDAVIGDALFRVGIATNASGRGPISAVPAQRRRTTTSMGKRRAGGGSTIRSRPIRCKDGQSSITTACRFRSGRSCRQCIGRPG